MVTLSLVMDLLSVYDCISFIDKLENTGLLNYADLSNVDTVHYTISKNLGSIATNLIRKSPLSSRTSL